ncbi:hypothetical protein BDZ89DRAFT_1127305 [Hymenopellis radicata]|nr:hypothetical protein BDZ89DRAFT_1127305 [Hymenopellis radicata]
MATRSTRSGGTAPQAGAPTPASRGTGRGGTTARGGSRGSVTARGGAALSRGGATPRGGTTVRRGGRGGVSALGNATNTDWEAKLKEKEAELEREREDRRKDQESLRKEQERAQALQRQIAAIPEPQNDEGVQELENQIAEQNARIEELEQQLEGQAQAGEQKIPRPHGPVNIQIAMGLSESAEDTSSYNSISRSVRRNIIRAGIDVTAQWKDISPVQKVELYAMCRQEHPILTEFLNDWPTELLAQQYVKNQRCAAYRRGEAQVPTGYEKMSENAAKRGSGNRKSKAKIALARKAADKREARRQRTAAQAEREAQQAASGSGQDTGGQGDDGHSDGGHDNGEHNNGGGDVHMANGTNGGGGGGNDELPRRENDGDGGMEGSG